MAKNTYTLIDYNKLAFQFAIRNPNVRALILSLDNEAIEHFRKNGLIDDRMDLSDLNAISKGTKLDKYSDSEKHLNSVYYDLLLEYGLSLYDILKHERQAVIHPIESLNRLTGCYSDKEDEIAAYKRINPLIESRGAKSKLERLVNGEAFSHYDAVILEGTSIYSLDPTTNKKKTIKSDVEFITKWIQPDLYLQLLPKYSS